MDIVAHALLGVALSRAGLQRVSKHATWLLLTAAVIPDVDYLARAGGVLAELEWRHGYTHSLLAIPLLAAVCVGLIAAFRREALDWFSAWWIACIGVASHLLLDWTGSQGIRAGLPFSSKWFHLDWNGAWDGVILAGLALALIGPWFGNLISDEIGQSKRQRGQGIAILILTLLFCYEGVRWTLHERAVNQLNARLYGDDGEVPSRVAALPHASPFQWTGVVETSGAFRTLTVSSFDVGIENDARVFVKPEPNAALKAAATTEAISYMQYFARFPVWQAGPVTLDKGIGTLVELSDLRPGLPHASALIDPAGRILESGVGSKSVGPH